MIILKGGGYYYGGNVLIQHQFNLNLSKKI